MFGKIGGCHDHSQPHPFNPPFHLFPQDLESIVASLQEDTRTLNRALSLSVMVQFECYNDGEGHLGYFTSWVRSVSGQICKRSLTPPNRL